MISTSCRRIRALFFVRIVIGQALLSVHRWRPHFLMDILTLKWRSISVYWNPIDILSSLVALKGSLWNFWTYKFSLDSSNEKLKLFNSMELTITVSIEWSNKIGLDNNKFISEYWLFIYSYTQSKLTFIEIKSKKISPICLKFSLAF